MSDNYSSTDPERDDMGDDLAGQWAAPASAKPLPWYRRRPGQVAITGVTATAVVVGGFAVVSVATDLGTPAPADALEQAFQSLAEEPFAVTLTSDDEDGSVRLVHTDNGTQVSVTSEDGSFEGAYANERLYLRIQPADSKGLGMDPMMTGFLAGFSSVDSLLKGEWVSVDVSEDSKVLDAVNDLSGTQASTADDPQLQAASEALGRSLQQIVEDLRGPVGAAVTDNSEITEPPAVGAERHLHLAVDVDELQSELEAPLSAARQDVIAAVEDFAAASGMSLPPGIEDPSLLRDKLGKAHRQAEDAESGLVTADFYLTDGEFSRIEAEGTQLVFDADPRLTAVENAVSLDEDLLRLLPLVASLMEQSSTFGTA